MKLKTRLVLSNILMLVIPVAVSLVVYYGGLQLFATIAGFAGRPHWGRQIMDIIGEGTRMMDDWSASEITPGEMLARTKEFNARNADKGFAFQIYKDGRAIDAPASSPNENILNLALEQEDNVSLFGMTSARARTINGYRVVLFEKPRIVEMNGSYRNVMFKGITLSLVCAAITVILMSKLLSQIVFGKILRGMATISGGAHQIRDGNLDFRIEYPYSDEFTPVCDDFNEMAERLRAAHETRFKDEMNRRELIVGISHDLRTPLTSIKAYVEGLEQGVAATDEARARYITTIKNKAGDLEHIIEALFLFSKLDMGESPYNMERADLSAVVCDIAGGAAIEYAPRGLEITVHPCTEANFVDIDVSHFRRVMTNIFENSLKYKTSGTGHVEVSVSTEGKTVVLEIKDDGPGVPDEAVNKLFELFYRFDPSRSNPSKGSGLGLALAAKVINHFGGTISAKNAEPRGLAITIRLPGR